MASTPEFENLIIEYEHQYLNHLQPTFKIGECINIRVGGVHHGWRDFKNKPGVYAFYDRDRQLIYVGHATNLNKQTGSYFRRAEDGRVVATVHHWVREPVFLQMVAVEKRVERASLEAFLIAKLNPLLNQQGGPSATGS